MSAEDGSARHQPNNVRIPVSGQLHRLGSTTFRLLGFSIDFRAAAGG